MPLRAALLTPVVLLAACASSRGAPPPAPAAPAVASAARDSVAGGPDRAPNSVAGSYNCIRTEQAGSARGSLGFQSQGYLTLAADGSYRFSASPMVGRYSVTPGTREVTWSGGYFADKGSASTTIPASGARRVEIVWRTRDGSTRWVCGVTAQQ